MKKVIALCATFLLCAAMLATVSSTQTTKSSGGVKSFNGRAGAVTLQSGDISTALGFNPGPAFVGGSVSQTTTFSGQVIANGASFSNGNPLLSVDGRSASGAGVPVQIFANPSAASAVQIYSSGSVLWFSVDSTGGLRPRVVTFSLLPTTNNGALMFCQDCTKATPCASGGNGAFAKRINGAWDCN